ncbi:MAG: ferrochelatase [Desulfobacterota bacterium]|nr:ferrochelatase [Thermodesulfobacteriota bacterium]
MKKTFLLIGLLVVLLSISTALSTKQDDTNYRKYLHQDRKIEGKAGVLLTALGQPEHYEFDFFNRYLTQIFNAAFPPALKPIILADRGVVLLDPDNATATVRFMPQRLVDCFGNDKNQDGQDYARLDLRWVEPRDKDSPGHYLWPEHKNGYSDIVEKVAIKILCNYYGKMPDKKIPYMHQHRMIFKEIEMMLAQEFPGVPMRWALAMYPETIEQAVDELIHEQVKTIVVVDFFHVYSALEEFNSLFPEIRDAVAERAKIVFAPFAGAYPSYRKAYVKMAEDEILKLPKEKSKLLILTRHGFPDIPGDPYPELARVYYYNLKREIEATLAGSNTHVLFADTDFAGEDMDPKEKRLATFEALEMGLEDGYDYIVFILVDFMSENTDSIFAHPTESLEPLHFEYTGEVPYYDFNKPFRLELRHGTTTIISAGCPVGDRYRPFISRGFFDAAATVLRGEPWPEILIPEEKKKKGMF